MKYLSCLAVIGLLPLVSTAQIPNPDFEQWSTSLYERPQGWTTFGIVKKVPGFRSNYAARMMRDPRMDDAPGAVVYGQPDNGFQGGVPFVGRPDSLVAFVRYHFVPGDSGLVVAFMKRGGNTIGENFFIYTGTDSAAFVRLAFKLNYNDTGATDSVIVGYASNNPEDTFNGSFLVVDSIHFTGSQVYPPLPNANFEVWDEVVREEPVGWFTQNTRVPAGLPFVVTKSSDKKFTQYSARIQNIKAGNTYLPGYVLAGRQGNSGPEPGFPVNFRDTVLYINYKFFPVNQDTLNIGILMYENGSMVGAGFLSGGDTVGTWTEAAININYQPLYSGTPDSAAIFAAPFQGGEDPTGESVLYVDGFKLNVAMTNVRAVSEMPEGLVVFPNPSQTHFNIIYQNINSGMVSLKLYNSNGVEVQDVFTGNLSAGTFSGSVNVTELPAGVYQCVLQTGIGKSTVKMLVTK